jgi:hypothetical protein
VGFPNRQASFVAGELTPLVWGRADLARYTQGLRHLENFIIHPQGGVSNRAGTVFVREIKDNQPARIIPFEFSPELGQTYVLEFTPGFLRVHAQGQTILAAGLPLEVPHPYVSPDPAELRRLRYAQSADVLTLVEGTLPAQDLKRLGHESWTITPFDLAATRPNAPVQAALTQPGAPLPNENIPSTQVFYVVTAVASDGQESLPSNAQSGLFWDFSGRPPIRVQWTAPPASVEVYNVYKAIGPTGFYGFVGQSKTLEFLDRALAPVFNQGPPEGRNPFLSQFPTHIAYFDQRLWFALIQTLHASQAGAFKNFDRSRPSNDDDAIEATLASLTIDKIRALVPMTQLVILTASNTYAVQGDPITPNDIGATAQEAEGCADLAPIVSGRAIVFLTAAGSTVRELLYEFAADTDGGWVSTDLGITSEHLFKGRRVVAWAFQKEPYGILWAVWDDGTLASLTRQKEHEVAGWARHDTDGFVEDVACVLEGEEHAVYLVVRRAVGGQQLRYLERMASRRAATETDHSTWQFLDCSLSYAGRNAAAGATMKITGGSWTPNTEADVFSQGIADPAYQFALGDVGDYVFFEQGLVRALILQVIGPQQVRVMVETSVPESLRDVFTPLWGIARGAVSGLSHLEGRTVSAMVDGGIHPPMVVSSGTVTLGDHYENIVVGLPYSSFAETLDLDTAGGTPLSARRKNVAQVTARVMVTRGLAVGEGLPDDAAQAIPPAKVYGGELESGSIEVRPQSTWNKGGRIRFQQDAPLPCTILSIEVDTEVGG